MSTSLFVRIVTVPVTHSGQDLLTIFLYVIVRVINRYPKDATIPLIESGKAEAPRATLGVSLLSNPRT